MSENKFYLLYNNKQQEKLLTTASTYNKLTGETEYYSEGVWFEYDTKEGSNFLSNEKQMKGIDFPATPKERDYDKLKKNIQEAKSNFKWVA